MDKMTEPQEKLNSEAKASTSTAGGPEFDDREAQAEASETSSAEDISHELSELDWRDVKIAELEARLSSYDQEIEKARDYVKRMEAEIKEIQTRSTREIETRVSQNFSKVILPFLEVVDHLEKAVEADPENVSSMQEGLEMILKQLQNKMAGFGVEKLSSMGQVFDPEIHEAISVQPNEEGEDERVLTVFQEAYRLNGKLIRPAKVIVGKKV